MNSTKKSKSKEKNYWPCEKDRLNNEASVETFFLDRFVNYLKNHDNLIMGQLDFITSAGELLSKHDEEVICRRCDVVMNKNTIGFKGGCNPIPFNYEVRAGKIFIDVKELEAHEKRFK